MTVFPCNNKCLTPSMVAPVSTVCCQPSRNVLLLWNLSHESNSMVYNASEILSANNPSLRPARTNATGFVCFVSWNRIYHAAQIRLAEKPWRNPGISSARRDSNLTPVLHWALLVLLSYWDGPLLWLQRKIRHGGGQSVALVLAKHWVTPSIRQQQRKRWDHFFPHKQAPLREDSKVTMAASKTRQLPLSWLPSSLSEPQ